jgi:hypothetical protein
MGSLRIGSQELFAWGWLLTAILLISASWVARITGARLKHEFLMFTKFFQALANGNPPLQTILLDNWYYIHSTDAVKWGWKEKEEQKFESDAVPLASTLTPSPTQYSLEQVLQPSRPSWGPIPAAGNCWVTFWVLRVREAPRPPPACAIALLPVGVCRQSCIFCMKSFPWNQVLSPISNSLHSFHHLLKAGVYKRARLLLAKGTIGASPGHFPLQVQGPSRLPEGCEEEPACSASSARAGRLRSFTSLP